MFQIGKIYTCQYVDYKNDPSPLLFVLHANNQYVEGLNVNYLNMYEQKTLAQYIMKYNIMFKDSGITGKLLYGILRRDIPQIINKVYRKYKFNLIRGFLVSNGLKEGVGEVIQQKVRFVQNGFIKYLQNLMDERAYPLQKAELQNKREVVNERMSFMGRIKKWWQQFI